MLISNISISQNLYDLNSITEIYIEFNESNWDAILDQYKSNDMEERLIASSVTINGVSYDSVGIKYKGNSTYNANNAKNPLNIKLDYILNQEHQGYSTLKLSNGFKDPSFVREVLSYEIARKYMDAPLANYAKVYINGSYYGLFSSSESINASYLERRFYSDKNNVRFKCNPNYGSGGSPSLEYLGTDSSLYFNSYELKSDFGWVDLVNFTNELNNNPTTIETYLDVDRALWMLAFDNILVNLDSYIGPLKQNYYLVKDDNNRFLPIVWDLNQSFGSFTSISSMGGGPGSTPTTLSDMTDLDLFLRLNDNTYPLINQLLNVPRYKKMYVAHCKTILDENFVNNEYYTRAQAMQNIIGSEVQNDPNAFYTYAEFTGNLDNTIGGGGGPGPGGSGVFGISELMNGRVSFIQSLNAYIASQPSITNITTPTTIYPNTTINITAEITNANYAYLGYRGYVGDVFTKVEMFDDGLHNDGVSGDNIYGVSIPIGASDIQYYIYSENTNAGIFSPQRAEHEFYNLIIYNDVVINEIMSKNDLAVTDQDGEYNDWVELYNNSNTAIDLSGYYLSDNNTNLVKWQIPLGTTIQPNDYLIIWLDKDTTQSGLHANFKLSGSGDNLCFSNPSGLLINEVIIPQMEGSMTYGRYPNGTGGFIRMFPTFSAQNSYTTISVEEVSEDFIFDVKLFPNPTNDNITVSINGADQCNLKIYNLNGSLIHNLNVTTNEIINLNDFNSGVYLFQLTSNNGLQMIKKVIKQ
jgi:hypothetical protein